MKNNIQIEKLLNYVKGYDKPYNMLLRINKDYEAQILTDAEYRSICDLLLIPTIYRIPAVQSAMTYLKKVAEVDITAFTKHCVWVEIKLKEMQCGMSKYDWDDRLNATLNIMCYVTFNVIHGKAYKKAVIDAFSYAAEMGCTGVKLWFLAKYFNKYFKIKLPYRDAMESPYRLLCYADRLHELMGFRGCSIYVRPALKQMLPVITGWRRVANACIDSEYCKTDPTDNVRFVTY